MHRMSMAALAGNRVEADAIDATLAGLHKALFVESNPIPVSGRWPRWRGSAPGYACH